MNSMPEDVIIDLLPLYFAGEASDASRALVDAYFAAHPDFAETMRDSMKARPAMPVHVPENKQRIGLKRLKHSMKIQSTLIAFGIFFTLLPLSFMYRYGKLEYLMLRDETAQAVVFACIALVDWIALWLLLRRMNTPQP